MQVSKWLFPLTVLALYTLAFFTSVWNGFIDYDSSAFSAIGFHVLEGKMLYTEVWDAKPPGVYLLNAFALGVFGVSQSSIWILQYLNGIAQIAMIYLIVSRLSEHRLLPPITSLLFVLVLYISPIYQGGNFTEEYANTFLLVGILFSLRFVQSPKLVELMVTSALFACTTMFKEPYLFSVIPWVMWLIMTGLTGIKSIKRVVVVVVGGLLPYVLLALFLLWNDAILGYWKHWVYNHAYSNYEAIPFLESLSRSYDFFWEVLNGQMIWVGYLTILFVVFIVLGKGLHRQLGIVLMCEFILGVYSVSMSGYQFQHYLLQLFPSVVLCTMLVFDQLGKRIPTRFFPTTLATFCILIFYTGYINIMNSSGGVNSPSSITFDRGATEIVANYINDHKSVDSRLFVEDIANTDLYLKTGLISDQYIPVNFFSFFVVPDKYGYERGEKYANSFYDSPPEFIVQSEKKGMLTQHKELNNWFQETYLEVELRSTGGLRLFRHY